MLQGQPTQTYRLEVGPRPPINQGIRDGLGAFRAHEAKAQVQRGQPSEAAQQLDALAAELGPGQAQGAQGSQRRRGGLRAAPGPAPLVLRREVSKESQRVEGLARRGLLLLDGRRAALARPSRGVLLLRRLLGGSLLLISLGLILCFSDFLSNCYLSSYLIDGKL